MKIDAEEIGKRYEQAKNDRLIYEPEMREAARGFLPREYGGWLSPDANPSAARDAARLALDTTAVRSVPKFVALCQRMATPDNYIWHGLQASDKELNRIPAVDRYFEDLTQCLFKYRYQGRAHFSETQQKKYTGIGVYGAGTGFVSKRKPTRTDKGGIIYRAPPQRDMFIEYDDEFDAYIYYRRLRMSAIQARRRWAEPTKLPKVIQQVIDQGGDASHARKFEICHFVGHRSNDHDPSALDGRRFPISEAYVSIESEKVFIGEPSGYMTMPFVMPLAYPDADHPYGWSIAMNVRDGNQGLQAMKRTVLKQGQKAADPVLLAADDGVLSGTISLRPGHINYGGINASSGKRMIDVLPTGDFNVPKEIIEGERYDLEDAFLVTVFRILQEHPEMKAAEVWDRASKEGALLAPTMGLLQSRDLEPLVEREIDILQQLRLAPEIPPELEEAGGQYTVLYTSPLAKSQRIEQVSAYSRLAGDAAQAAQITGNTRIMARFNYDRFIPDAADIMSIPNDWLNSDEELEAMDKALAADKAVEQFTQAAPGIAGIGKAMADNRNQPAPAA